MIIISILLLVVGMFLLIKGADLFVEGASAIAKAMKIPSLIIGLTLVSIGTSAPELSVSLTSSIKGLNDLSFGNVVGSNIFNTFVVIGVSAIITPLIVSKSIKKYDIPVLIGIYLILGLFSFLISPNIIERWEAIIIFILTIVYTIFLILRSKKENQANEEENSNGNSKKHDIIFLAAIDIALSIFLFLISPNVIETWETIVLCLLVCVYVVFVFLLKKKEENNVEKVEKSNLVKWVINLLLVGIGLIGIILGGQLVVDNASIIAIKLGMSEMLVGLTIVAIGTSLPELVTSVVAAKKGEADIAVGNVLGSNIFNVILILGLSATIAPMPVANSSLFDVIVMIVCIIVLFIFSFKNNKVNRWQGLILITMYAAYLTYIIIR